MSYTENEDALNDLNNIRGFLKERGLIDEPCKEGSKYTIGDIVEDFAYLVDKAVKARVDRQIQTKKNKVYRNTKEHLNKQYDDIEKEMRTDEFKAKYKCILPERVTFSVWWDSFEDEDSLLYADSWPYEKKGVRGSVEFEHVDEEWVHRNWHNKNLYELSQKLTVDDLVPSDIIL
tara:strand:- start:322 stop:846 length:525 start_codon:yes stop_codon:yes gene_type:complete